MKKASLVALAIAVAGALLLSADWASSSGNPQRDGWARNEKGLSRDAAIKGDIKHLYSFRLDTKAQRFTTPVVVSNIIAVKGFKALLFIAGTSDVYAIDSEMGRAYAKTHLAYTSGIPPNNASTATCSGGITASVAISGNSANAGRGGGGAAGGRGASGAPAVPPPPPPAAAGAPGASGRGGGGGGRGGAPYVWAVGADGRLFTIREQDGDASWIAPVSFLPPNADVSGLNFNNNVIYAATANSCGGARSGLYAAEFTPPQLPPTPGAPVLAPASFKVTSFMTNGNGFAGSGGVAAATDGTVYGLVTDGRGDMAGPYSDTVIALDGKSLAVKDYFTPSGTRAAVKADSPAPGATPAIFQWNGRDVVLSGGRDGKLYLLDAASLGGSDHHTPLAQSEVFAAADGVNGIWNSFATWEDPNGNARWVYASISGASPAKFAMTNGAAPTGSIVAFKIDNTGGKPSFSPQWISRDLTMPAAPAIANGLVFALSTGQGRAPKNAVLYALDSGTGKELWSSGVTATSYATGGLAINSSAVFFATHDGALHAYGIPIIF